MKVNNEDHNDEVAPSDSSEEEAVEVDACTEYDCS